MAVELITGQQTRTRARNRARAQPADFLGNFSVADHARVRGLARHRELVAGDCLFDQGSVATAAFVVTGGEAEVIVHGRPVGEIAAGTIIGDVDVLGRRPYRCRVEARTTMTVWQIDATDLDRLLIDAPTFARALARDLGRRLRAAEVSLATGDRRHP
jgi:CRP-like cAMP-binding protein